jgi:hypothetical protein
VQSAKGGARVRGAQAQGSQTTAQNLAFINTAPRKTEQRIKTNYGY